jgi:hypothetical protein
MPPLHDDDSSDMRTRAYRFLRTLRGQGYDRSLITCLAAEVLGQLKSTIEPELPEGHG